MTQRKMSMGFEKWQTEAAQMKEEARKLQQALMRMSKRHLAAAFGTWRSIVAELAASKFVTGQVKQESLSWIFTRLTIWAASASKVYALVLRWRNACLCEAGITSKVKHHAASRLVMWIYEWRADSMFKAMLKWKNTTDIKIVERLSKKLEVANRDAEEFLIQELRKSVGATHRKGVTLAFDEWKLINDAANQAETQEQILKMKVKWAMGTIQTRKKQLKSLKKPALHLDVEAFLKEIAVIWTRPRRKTSPLRRVVKKVIKEKPKLPPGRNQLACGKRVHLGTGGETRSTCN